MLENHGRGSTISGSWQNQLGTCLDLRADEDGTVRGSIHSDVGGVKGAQPVVGYIRPVSGRRGAIGLVVSWEQTHSVTTWCGHYDLDADVVAANWLLTTADFDKNEWQSTRVGYDVFRRGPVAAEASEVGTPLSTSVTSPNC